TWRSASSSGATSGCRRRPPPPFASSTPWPSRRDSAARTSSPCCPCTGGGRVAASRRGRDGSHPEVGTLNVLAPGQLLPRAAQRHASVLEDVGVVAQAQGEVGVLH